MSETKNRVYYSTVLTAENVNIIVLNSHRNLYSISEIVRQHANKPVHIVCGIWWTIETPKQFLKITLTFLKNKIKYPKIQFSVLANTPRELLLLKLIGIKAIFCNQNCFIDENIFRIEKGTTKKFDAIYNAVLSEFKQHQLCKELQDLALITYNFKNLAYKKFLDKILPSPYWYNYVDPENPVFLDNDELNIAYNTAKVGLALSSEEGSMYASNEYLYCGIPVVSVKSIGGRDVFYNKLNSLIVSSDSHSLKKGVDEMISRNINPDQIREDVIEQSKIHRDRFTQHINSIFAKYGDNVNITDTWNEWFTHKLRHELTKEQIIGLITSPNKVK
ncbi:MAG: hypothetical protein M3O71_24905 [Bacteroidota bacterium]|nr:hypothetical protein [Bacteroidota bacterium]